MRRPYIDALHQIDASTTLYLFGVYLNANVVNATTSVLLEEVGHGRLVAERVQELDLGLTKLHKRNRHAMVRESLLVTS